MSSVPLVSFYYAPNSVSPGLTPLHHSSLIINLVYHCIILHLLLCLSPSPTHSLDYLKVANSQMTYGEPNIRKCVPLALGLISASKPQLPIIDALSKYSHDQDLEVALNAIFAMGLIGAGTNNARLAQMLRMLAIYYATEADCLFVVRIAQVRISGRQAVSFSLPQSDRSFSPFLPWPTGPLPTSSSPGMSM